MQRSMKVSISKQALADLPAAKFEGNIYMVDDPALVERAIAALRASDIIGFDTETRPSFKKGQTHTVALLQLSTRSVCYLFRLNKLGMPQPLKALLEDPEIKKIGLSTHDDFFNLRKICDLQPAGFVELQDYVKNWDIADASLSKIYAILFGKRISKGQRLTNWEADELTEPQQAYAAFDAMACIDIYEHLSQGLFDPEESTYKETPEPETEQEQ